MNRWLLFLGVIYVALVCSGCGRKMSELQKTDQQWELSKLSPIFHDSLVEVVYDLSIQYKDDLNSGILAVAFESPGYYRMVFLNKAGPTLFDLTFSPESMTVNSIIDALDKKILLNILEKDFRMLLDPIVSRNQTNFLDQTDGSQVIKLKDKTTYYYFLSTPGRIKEVHRAKGCRSIVEMKLYYSDADQPEHIDIRHIRIPLTLNLKQL